MKNISRRHALSLAASAGTAAIIGAPTILRAAAYPSHPITLVNPNPPSGYVDAMCRVMSGPMSKAFGQPVVVVNIPGASEMLGFEQYLRDADDGYFLVACAATYIPLNILLQKATFKPEDFQMVNLSARDYTLMASGPDSKLKTAGDLVAALKKNPASLSIGVVRVSSDNVNVALFLQSIGVDYQKARIVTFENGGSVRPAVMGNVVDCGFVGGEGFEPIADQVTPLLTFDTKRHAPFTAVPTVGEAALGKPFDPVAGSLRGFAVQATMKTRHPDVYAKVLSTMEAVYKDPKVIAAMKSQSLAPTWYGPDDSQDIYLKTCAQMVQYAGLLKKGA
ncbi:MAG TPA: tripartite tricarboxylate transporter substrate binding protein [Stellaceae bacterium]|jgi:tripartite-type tricarboxylate transporter receptor subunit TctC|nr:tripartite tricarboxylate transporter substrate binding protein [Stellaceae bacterium]